MFIWKQAKVYKIVWYPAKYANVFIEVKSLLSRDKASNSRDKNRCDSEQNVFVYATLSPSRQTKRKNTKNPFAL